MDREIESNELTVFDELKAGIAEVVAPIKDLKVADDTSADLAIETAKTIKHFLSLAETKRKELVGPLNDRVKSINQYVKDLTFDLVQADTHVKRQLAKYAEQQEVARQAELARIEQERIATEKRLAEEREAEESKFIESAESTMTDPEVGALFGTDVEDDVKKQWETKQEELDKKEAIARSELKQKEWDAERVQIRNTRRTLKVRVTDIGLVPKEFLIIQVNEKAAAAAGKAGAKIPGLEFYWDFQVAVGRNTYVPSLKKVGHE